MRIRRIQPGEGSESNSSIREARKRHSLEPTHGLGEERLNSARCRASTSPIDLLGLRILVLRGGALGDLILTLPVLGEIRKSYPDAEVVLLGIFPQARLAVPEFVDRVERMDAPDLVPIFVEGPCRRSSEIALSGFDLAIIFLLRSGFESLPGIWRPPG